VAAIPVGERLGTIMNLADASHDTLRKNQNNIISIFECNGIGMLQACIFAKAGYTVIGVVLNPHTRKQIEKSSLQLKANKIVQQLRRYMKEGLFSLSADARAAASKSDIILIVVQPRIDKRKKPDYSPIEKMCKDIGMGIKRGSLILFTGMTGPSTVEGSLREILEITSGLTAGEDFSLAFSSIYLNPKDLSTQTSKPLRFIGAIDQASLAVTDNVLESIEDSEIVKVSNIRTAEAINIFRKARAATNLALTNELALLCERLNIDFLEVLNALQKDTILETPFPGIASNSVRRASYILQDEAENVDLKLRLISLSRKINDEIIDHAFRLVKELLKIRKKTVSRAKISILGISGLENQKAPPRLLTRKFVDLLQRKVRKVQVYDPFFSKKELIELGLEAETFSKVCESTDCVIVMVGHSKFERLNLRNIRLLARKNPALLDLGYILDPHKVEKYGFAYRGFGRGIWSK